MRRATWLLWLMLALLPLRSWAVASMGVPPLSGGDAAVVAAAPGTEHADGARGDSPTMPPCHAAADASDLPSTSGNPCQACDWCHAAMGPAPRVIAGTCAPLASDRPAALSARDTGRAAISGLERPPRLHLA